jgi:hypothetical protein
MANTPQRQRLTTARRSTLEALSSSRRVTPGNRLDTFGGDETSYVGSTLEPHDYEKTLHSDVLSTSPTAHGLAAWAKDTSLAPPPEAQYIASESTERRTAGEAIDHESWELRTETTQPYDEQGDVCPH